MNEWPIGSKMDLPIQVLARDLKGHRFVVSVPGKSMGTYYQQLVEVTGEVTMPADGNMMLEVKAVKPDA